jgi:hypothetical protein
VGLTELSEAVKSSALEEVRREGIVFGGGCLCVVVAVRGIVVFLCKNFTINLNFRLFLIII